MFRRELGLLFGRRRTIALLVVLCLIPIVVGVAVDLSGGPGQGTGPEFVAQIAGNGVFLALAGLTIVSQFFLPLTVAIVAGDAIAGEASLGTLRYLLVRPVGRTTLLAAKLGGIVAFCLAAAVAVSLTGLATGVVLFPIGRVTSLSGLAIPLLDGVARILLGAAVVGASMVGLGAAGLFVSTLTEAPMGAMAATAGLFVACLVMDGIPQLHAIQPILFTHHWDAFADLLRVPITWGNIVSDLALQLGWGAVAVLAAWARFTTADVLA